MRVSITTICSLSTVLTMLAIFVGGLGGCAVEDDVHVISIHQLRIEPDHYVGERVELRGYLSRRWGPETGVPYLFATIDDARMANQAAGVFVDLYGNKRSTNVSACMQQYVQIEAEFGPALDPEAGGGLSLRNVRYLWVVTTTSSGSSESSQELETCVAPPESGPSS